MKNLEKLSDNEHKIDLISLNNFLIQNGDSYLKDLINDYNFVNKEQITKEYFQENYEKIFRYSSDRNNMDFTGDDFPVEWYSSDIIKKIIQTFKNDGYTILYLNSNIDGYYKFCEEQVTQNGYRLRLVPLHLIDYNLSEKAILQDSEHLEFVPKNIENYYSLVKLAFKKKNSIIYRSWFPIKYIPKLKQDFSKNPILQNYTLQEYISKEIRKLLKETLFNLK